MCTYLFLAWQIRYRNLSVGLVNTPIGSCDSKISNKRIVDIEAVVYCDQVCVNCGKLVCNIDGKKYGRGLYIVCKVLEVIWLTKEGNSRAL